MNTSPIITSALIEARRSDLLANARQARRAHEAQQANRTRRDAAPAPVRHPRRGWQLSLAGLFGAR